VSPTEAELRAFLHEGEGEVPDATSAISRAVRVRYERRRRITVMASSAAVVAVIATGLSFLVANTGDETAGGNSAAPLAGGAAAGTPAHAGASAAPHGAVTKAPVAMPTDKRDSAPAPSGGGRVTGGAGGGTSFRGDARALQSAVAGIACPPSPASYALPGGGGLNSYGAGQPMFARRPAAIKLCSYSLVSRSGPESVVLSAGATGRLTRAIERSPSLPGPSRMCPARAADANRRIQLISVDASGRRLRPVTISFDSCGPARVTNGTSVRYLDRVPPALRKLVEPGSPAR
jgi:hypothetical protein